MAFYSYSLYLHSNAGSRANFDQMIPFDYWTNMAIIHSPNKIELFVIGGDSASAKAENNLKEFLDNFKDAKFEKHFQNEKITQEIGIKTFPAFIVNNRDKFSGIQAADTIKENYCSLNQNENCKKSLSKNLV